MKNLQKKWPPLDIKRSTFNEQLFTCKRVANSSWQIALSSISSIAFGDYVRNLRSRRNIGQRRLARLIGVSSSYLNDIEKAKRSVPRQKLVGAIAEILHADVGRINNFAGISKKSAPA